VFYLLESDGSLHAVDEYSVNELDHSDMKKDGMTVTALNLYGNSGNVLAKIYSKGIKGSFEHSFTSEVTAVCAGASNAAFVFGNEIEIYDQKDVLTGKISLPQACLGCTLSDNRIYVCVSGGIYSFNVSENYEVE
ncbi:MAG: hypothetical protein J1E34_10050, partial [Oscillospiraceae bacterium]|nr:hypothetical protein [Oscillospiraceae bacterium]